MIGEKLRIPAADGYPLAATCFAPAAAPNGRAVVVNAAMGVKRGFYAPFALYLADRGFAVVTYDYRGIAGSRPERLRGFPARTQDWGERDLAGVIEWSSARLPATHLLVVGHSIGGQIVGLAPNAHRLAGLLGIAAQSGYWGHWPMPRRLLMWALWHSALPLGARALGFFPGKRLGLGEDLPAGVARQWAEWGRSPHYIAGAPGSSRRERFARLALAIRAYSFSDDHYAPRLAVDALLEFYRGSRTEHRHVAPRDVGLARIGHFGFFKDTAGAVLWPEAAAWLAEA
jgi:predicted alpha/beta hydrolase